MSHQLSMLVQNNSSHTLLSYSVAHSWDGHNEIIRGNNLANGVTSSPSVEIISGYTQYDWRYVPDFKNQTSQKSQTRIRM